MRHPKIVYLQLAIIITILSPVEIYSESIRTVTNGAKNRQVQISKEKSLRLKKQPVMEKPAVSDDDDERKTLAQQVLDGKYGLIQTELFSSPVKRPGIISYEINPEVPTDNINNLGGLKPEEIWLAENHLLVLKGGSFSDNEQGGKVMWPPIDSYIAPQRQVKIPPNPKIPPPFPIQLKEGGPIEIIKGKNVTKAFPSYFEPPFLFQNQGNIPNKANENETKLRQGNLTKGNGGIPFPFPPPGIGLFPPAIAFLPPPENLTELDEDDPSIYYPPRYDFVYTKNYTSYVPPGPLVPGIILPPPPNFFAPLENKTRSDRFNSADKAISLTNKTRLPALNRPRYKIPSQINSFKPKGLHISHEQKSLVPLQQILNKNKTNGEWVPIPAPRPFYITDINKLKIISGDNTNNRKFEYDLPKNGWVYENTTKKDFLIENLNPQEHKSNRVNKNMGIYPTTDVSNENYNTVTSPQISTTSFQHHDTILNNKEKHLVPNNNNKHIQLTNIKVLKSSLAENSAPPRPSKQYYYNRPYFESNTLLPQVIYEDVTVKTPSTNGRIVVPTIKYDDYRNTLKHTSKPLSFLYYEQEPKYQADDGGYIYEIPENSALNPYKSEQFRATPVNPNNIMSYRTTQKPPIYEYSYSAPGYGTVEAPKVGNNFETTPKPVIYESNFKSAKQPQHTYYEYKTTPKQNEFNFQESTVDSYYSTIQPPIKVKNKYINIESYQKEKSYTSYNTQDIGLLDDNTKKYFTLFGQKINQDNRAITTSIPQANQNFYSKPYYQNYDNVTPLPTKMSNKNIRFPELYNIQSDRPYYTKEEYSTPKYRNSNKKTKSNAAIDNYSYFYGPSNIGFQTYKEYEHDIVQPNHSLDSDININYKIPNPTINPDAEFIDPTYMNPPSYKENSYVSYRLPGNSGHFYFLMPQTMQQNYQVRDRRARYTEEETSPLVGRRKILN